MNTITSGCGNCWYCNNGQCTNVNPCTDQTQWTNTLLDKNMYPSKPPMRIEVILTEDRVRQIFREELIKVLDTYSDILYYGVVKVDKNGDIWRRTPSPQEAIRELKDTLKDEEND